MKTYNDRFCGYGNQLICKWLPPCASINYELRSCLCIVCLVDGRMISIIILMRSSISQKKNCTFIFVHVCNNFIAHIHRYKAMLIDMYIWLVHFDVRKKTMKTNHILYLCLTQQQRIGRVHTQCSRWHNIGIYFDHGR